MNALSSLPSMSYVECARRLRRLHEFIRSGNGDSVEAENLRDEMDHCWGRMRAEERDLTKELSADLNAVGVILRLNESQSSDVEIRRQFLEAEYSGDWDQVRALIEEGAGKLGMSDRILFRATYWGGRGDFESGYLFLQFLVAVLERDQRESDRNFLDLKSWSEDFASSSLDLPLREKVSRLIKEAENAKRRSSDSVELMKYQIDNLGVTIEAEGDLSSISGPDWNEARLAFFNACSSAFLLPAA